ncbi:MULTISPECIES: ABC transporter substrate-binding protein [Xenorhabdus]|uniref:ABC transporter substrate-binding protein n=1 Tax=Xenorhabdus TaxID=626 RepID=UPI00064674D5|nr:MULTISPECIES: ABC transporter substrate-binding protein [Xenorhabdus]MBC8945689.1 periplasmic hemin-binding protein [Xenorhabdus indica]
MINNTFKVIATFYITSMAAGVATAGITTDSAIEFRDMSQQVIHLSIPAERIVVIPIPAASMLAGLDESSDKLVGMHPFAGVAARDGMLSKIFPDVLNIRTDMVGNNFTPNIEALLNVQPDLVWQWGHRGDDIISPMRNAGLTVATLNYGGESCTQEWIRLMGLTLGHDKKAEEMISWRQEVISQLSIITDKIPEAKRPRVLYLSHFHQRIQTFGSASHNNADFALAGGVSLNRDLIGPRTLNIEQILLWDPDIILLGNFEAGLSPADIYHNPILSDVTAVKNKRVYKLPIGGFIWDAPNQETPLYWQWLSMIFHPDTIHWPLRDEIHKRYQQLYGYRLTESQIDDILQLKLNQQGRDYLKLMEQPHE